MKRTGLLLILIIAACAPSAQERAEPEEAAQMPSPQETERNTQLLGNTLSVPDTSSTVAVDAPFLQGELASFAAGADRGTVRLLSEGMAVTQSGRDFLVLPVEVLRVSGAGGLYLLLLEQTGETLTQRDAAALGQRVSLLGLALEDDLITATTVDSRLGKAPDFEVTRGGVTRFRLQEGALVEAQQG